MGKVMALLLMASLVYAKDQGINIQIIQDSDGARIGGDSSQVAIAINKPIDTLPRRGITGVHYLDDQGKNKYFRKSLSIQDDEGDSIVFLYHQKGAWENQLSQMAISRRSISHLTFPGYAISFYDGKPASRVGLWESESHVQPAWIVLGVASIGAGVAGGLAWKHLHPAITRDLPRNYRLTPQYEAYETHRWQEKDLIKQKRRLKAIGIASIGAGVFGAGCLIEGFSTHLQIMLGSGAMLTCKF